MSSRRAIPGSLSTMNTRVGIEPQGLARWPGPIALISIAQLLGTSIWFSANGAGPGLMREWQASGVDIGHLTSAVQIGFILGTLTISLTGLADRFRAATFTNSGSWGNISCIVRRQTGTRERENGQIVRCNAAWGG